jgi:hypothetical protein
MPNNRFIMQSHGSGVPREPLRILQIGSFQFATMRCSHRGDSEESKTACNTPAVRLILHVVGRFTGPLSPCPTSP